MIAWRPDARLMPDSDATLSEHLAELKEKLAALDAPAEFLAFKAASRPLSSIRPHNHPDPAAWSTIRIG